MKTESELLSWISFTGIEIIITSGTGGVNGSLLLRHYSPLALCQLCWYIRYTEYTVYF